MKEQDTQLMNNKEQSRLRNKAQIGDKIRENRMRRGINAQDLSLLLGQARSAVTNWESGYARPDLFLVPELCKALGISLEEFFSVQADRKTISDEDLKLIEGYHSLSKKDRELIDSIMEKMLSKAEAEREEELVKRCKWLPESDLKACAGSGNYLDSSHDVRYTYLYNCYSVGMADEIITVAGNSMEPTFHDGDKLLVQHTKTVRPGEVGIFIWNGEGLVKEYQRDGLYPHNKDYAVIRPNENDDLRCIGRVMGAVSPDMKVSAMERYVLEKARKKAM